MQHRRLGRTGFEVSAIGFGAWARRHEEAGLEPFDDTPIPQRRRFFCRDPVDILIEFTRIEGDYLK
jgi:hypothetical protein